MKPIDNGRRMLVLMLSLVLLAALALGGLYLYADTLYRGLLGGKGSAAQEKAFVSSFDLFAEENRHQTQSRISGWLSYVSSQEVSIRSERGMLSAMLFDPLSAQANAPWAIVLHGGLGTDREQVIDVACELSLAGYRVLTPDLYAHGRSEGEASTLGFSDSQDVNAWIDYIEQTQMGARIVLFGQDEGAAAVLLAACEGLSESVAAVAADSPCDDGMQRAVQLAGIEDDAFRRTMIEAFFRMKTGLETVRISERIAAARTPLLLIHGTGDQDVPAWQSEDIALAAGENAQLLYVEGAGHGLSRYVEPQTYYDALLGFFEQALGDEPNLSADGLSAFF